MENLNFMLLNNKEMKSIKGGIILEHVMSYNGLLSKTFQEDNVEQNAENNEIADQNRFVSQSIFQDEIIEED